MTQIKTNTEYESYFWVRWEQASQDIPGNKTIINWSCGVYCGHNFLKNAIKMSAFTINGVQVYAGGKYSNFDKGDRQIASGQLEIPHNTDGTKTFTISSFTGWLYSDHNYSSNGGSYTLTAIPRKATITSATDFADTGTPSLTFSNPGNFPLDVWLEPNIDAIHLCIRHDISGTSGTYKWKLTDEERDELRSKCAGTECTIRYGLHSTVGGTIYSDYEDKKFTLTENDATRPEVFMGVSIDNGKLPSAFKDMYIQGKSKAFVTVSADAKYNSSIKSYYAMVEGKKYESDAITSDVLQKSGSMDIFGYAVDSRGFTGSASKTINVVEYSKPLVVPLSTENAILCYRSDVNGNRTGNSTSVWIKAKRSYYNLSNKNTCALQWRRKLVTEAWDDSKHLWNDLIPYSNTTTHEYNAQIDGVFDLKNSYSIQIQAIDAIGETDTRTFEIPTQDVALHLGKGGKNVSVGTYCDYSEERTFYSDWKAIFDKEVVIGGSSVRDIVVDCTKNDSTGYFKQTWLSGKTEFYRERKFFDVSNPDVLSWAWQLTTEGFDGIMHIQLGNGAKAPTTYCNGLVISNKSNRCNVVVFGATEIYTNLNQGDGWLGWRKISTTAVT